MPSIKARKVISDLMHSSTVWQKQTYYWRTGERLNPSKTSVILIRGFLISHGAIFAISDLSSFQNASGGIQGQSTSQKLENVAQLILL